MNHDYQNLINHSPQDFSISIQMRNISIEHGHPSRPSSLGSLTVALFQKGRSDQSQRRTQAAQGDKFGRRIWPWIPTVGTVTSGWFHYDFHSQNLLFTGFPCWFVHVVLLVCSWSLFMLKHTMMYCSVHALHVLFIWPKNAHSNWFQFPHPLRTQSRLGQGKLEESQGKLEESEKLVVAERHKIELLEKEVECVDSERKSRGMVIECRKCCLVFWYFVWKFIF